MKIVNVSNVRWADWKAIAVASATLSIQEHDADCPVRHGASATCCWPIAVCVPDTFALLEDVRETVRGEGPRR